MDPQQSLERIKQLSLLRANWHSVASEVAAVAAERGWRSGDVAMNEWVARAALAANVTPNTIGRLVAARDFLHRVAGPKVASRWGDLDQLPFSSVEILKRIDAINVDAARALLDPAMKGEIPVRELRERYEALVSNRADGRMQARANTKREGAAFIKSMQTALERDLRSFGCGPSIELYRGRFKDSRFSLHINGIAFDPRDISGTIVGFDGHMTRNVRPINLFLYRMAYVSAFFARYVVVFASDADQEGLLELQTTLRETGRTNIDVALLTVDESAAPQVRLLGTPVVNAGPLPDCRPLMAWDTVLKQPNS